MFSTRFFLICFLFFTTIAQAQTVPGLVWTYPDNGQMWIAEQVSLGNHGTQAYAHHYLNNMRTALLSVHDGNPPAPVWQDVISSANPKGCDGAKQADIFVSITETPTATINQRIIEVRKFTSAGPDWVYAYPHLTAGRLHVQISHDGQIIAACVGNPVTGMNDILVFHPSSPVPVNTWTMPGGTLWGFDLSSDGSRAVFGIHTYQYVLDISNGAILHSKNTYMAMSNVGLAISADGNILAFGGGSGTITIYDWNGSSYVKSHTRKWSGGGLVRVIAISDDASTVVYGMGQAYPSTQVHVEAMDLNSYTITMEETVSSYGQYQNSILDIAVSADGNTFVGAYMGDAPNIVEEVRMFNKYQNTPIATINLPGSAFNVDISLDGKWVLAGSKAVHGNKSGNGGQIDLYHLGGCDLTLNGVPSLGNTVQLELYGTPGEKAGLLASTQWDPNPVFYPGLGTFYLGWTPLFVIPLPDIGVNGKTSMALTLIGTPSLIGASLYFQGITDPPLTLSESWVAMTLLP